MDAIGMCFWNARGRHGYSFADVARLLGAGSERQLRKTMAWLVRLEQHGLVEGDEEFLPELLSVLEIDPAELQALVERKRARIEAEFEAWASVEEPIALYWKPMPAIVLRVDLGHLSEDEALAYGSKFAKSTSWDVFVRLNRRISVWFEARTGRETCRTEETPDTSHLPYVRIGNKSVESLFEPMDGGRS